MKTTRIVLSLIVLSMLWCADVFAHNNPAAHFCPGTTDDPCFGTGCDQGSDYDGGHGHIDTFKRKDGTMLGNGEMYVPSVHRARSWGYWTAGGYAAAGGTLDDSGWCGGGNNDGNGNGNGNGDGNGDGNGGGGGDGNGGGGGDGNGGGGGDGNGGGGGDGNGGGGTVMAVAVATETPLLIRLHRWQWLRNW